MVKVAARKNVEACVSYFLAGNGLCDNEKQGHWVGQGAQILGLNPKPSAETPNPSARLISEDDLRAVLRGYSPPSSEIGAGYRLNGRYYPEGRRRCAYDCVVTPHKSISIANSRSRKRMPLSKPLFESQIRRRGN